MPTALELLAYLQSTGTGGRKLDTLTKLTKDNPRASADEGFKVLHDRCGPYQPTADSPYPPPDRLFAPHTIEKAKRFLDCGGLPPEPKAGDVSVQNELNALRAHIAMLESRLAESVKVPAKEQPKTAGK